MEKAPQQPKKYDFEGGDYLNPEEMSSLPENNTEIGEDIWNFHEEHMEMMSGEVFDAAVRPNMTEEEIQELAHYYVSEYEGEERVKDEEAKEKEEKNVMKEAEENRREISEDGKENGENGMSLAFRAVEMVKDYLNDHPAVAKLVFPAVVASQLAGCAVGGYYPGRMIRNEMRGRYRIEETLARGQMRAEQREVRGSYRAQSTLERGVQRAEHYRERAYASLRREATPEDTERIEAEYNMRVREAEMHARQIEDNATMGAQMIRGNAEMRAQMIAENTRMRQYMIQDQMARRMVRHALHGIYSGHSHYHW